MFKALPALFAGPLALFAASRRPEVNIISLVDSKMNGEDGQFCTKLQVDILFSLTKSTSTSSIFPQTSGNMHLHIYSTSITQQRDRETRYIRKASIRYPGSSTVVNKSKRREATPRKATVFRERHNHRSSPCRRGRPEPYLVDRRQHQHPYLPQRAYFVEGQTPNGRSATMLIVTSLAHLLVSPDRSDHRDERLIHVDTLLCRRLDTLRIEPLR